MIGEGGVGPEIFHEQDIVGPDTTGDASLELGSIGWDDSDVVFDAGDGTNGGGTLIRVQLYRGRNPGDRYADRRAHGAKTIAQIPGGLFRVPPKDTMCLIGHPHQMQTAPGGAVLLAVLDKVASAATFGNIQLGELCLHGDGADALSRILMKKNGAISIFALEGNAAGGKPVAVLVNAEAGSITLLNQHGTIALTSDQVAILYPPGGISIDSSGNVTLIGNNMVVQGAATLVRSGTVDLGLAGGSGVAIQLGLSAWMGFITTALTQIVTGLIATPTGSTPGGPVNIAALAATTALGFAATAAPAAFSTTVKAAP